MLSRAAVPRPSTASTATFGLISSLFVVTLPLIALGTALLVLVYHFRVQHHPVSTPDFQSVNTTGDPDVFYVNYDATRLTTVASWSSSLAVLLPSYIMTLASFAFVAAMTKYSEIERIERLPTAQQLALVLDMKTGGLGALWSALVYNFTRQREAQPRNATLFMFLLLISVALGYATLTCDTWLHLTTTTIAFTQVSDISTPTRLYGRDFMPGCLQNDQCAVEDGETAGWAINYPAELYNTLNNLSTNNQIRIANIDDRRLLYISPVTTEADIDYRTSTFAVESSCTPVTSYCYRDAIEASAEFKFNCSSGFNSDNVNSSISAESGDSREITELYFSNPAWTDPVTYDETNPGNVTNPLYTLFRISQDTTTTQGLGLAGEIASGNEDFIGYSWIMSCNTTFHNMNYTVVGNVLSQATIQPINNPILIANVFATNALALIDDFVENAALLASLQDTRLGVDQTFADLYNYAYLAPAASVMTNATNIAEQRRESLLVTRLPKAPFFALLACLILAALYGIFVSFIAIKSRPFRHNAAFLRFSTAGIVSSHFEEPEHAESPAHDTAGLFEESFGLPEKPRIGMLPSEHGGRMYASWIVGKSELRHPVSDDKMTSSSQRHLSHPSLHIEYDDSRAEISDNLSQDFRSDFFFTPSDGESGRDDMAWDDDRPGHQRTGTETSLLATSVSQGGVATGGPLAGVGKNRTIRRKPVSGTFTLGL